MHVTVNVEVYAHAARWGSKTAMGSKCIFILILSSLCCYWVKDCNNPSSDLFSSLLLLLRFI